MRCFCGGPLVSLQDGLTTGPGSVKLLDMSIVRIPATGIREGMTLVIDGQHHIVDRALPDPYGLIQVSAETVIGDMGERSFEFDPDQLVTVIPSITDQNDDADDYQCPRLLVGLGSDTRDPRCLMPAGHSGRCTADAQDALIALHMEYDRSGSDEAWGRIQAHKRWLREHGYEWDVQRYEERGEEAAAARGFW